MRLLLTTVVTLLACEAVKIKGPDGKIYNKGKKTQDGAYLEAGRDKGDIFEINKDVPGLIDVDVLPRRDEKDGKNAITNTARLWPSTNIPFRFSNISGIEIGLEAVGSIQLARREYKLRTCLNFIPQTTEENYISFQRRSGCFSSVGMVGGFQTISIGTNCERLGTVCHEMMHAIGVYHEQSRADRDDYVEIQWDIITPGRENNFAKYDWVTTDPRRLPYDYNSIMHYSDSGFSTTGDPTIVTRDPAFQDIIGQRSTFSRSDSEKINRLYKCSDTLLNTYNCNYDDVADCGYVQDFDSDQIDWLRYDVGDDAVNVPTNAPLTDATLGITGKGTYMVLDTSGATEGLQAEMRSMRFVSKSEVQCLQFSYYLNKNKGSSASVAVHVGLLDDDNGTVLEYGVPIVTLDTNYGSDWQFHRMTINAPPAYKIIFMGNTGASKDVVAIDDVSVQDKPCEDAYFVTHDWSTTFKNYSKGEFFVSPVMTTDEGYSFRIKVYPQGTTSARDGYMSMWFGLVKGPKDDELTWPYCNRFVRMMIVDQNDNPLYSLHRMFEFLTSQELGGAMWNRPNSTDVPSGYYGLHNFFRIKDLENTNNYLKHDSLLVSLLTQNMNYVRGNVCNGSFTRTSENSDAVPKTKSVDEENHVGIDWVNSPTADTDDHHHGEHHHHHHHDEHHQGGNPETHDEDHEENDEKMVSIGATIGVALGCGAFVLLVMSSVLCCVAKSHKSTMQTVANRLIVHTHTQVPPAYPEDPITFDDLPMPKV